MFSLIYFGSKISSEPGLQSNLWCSTLRETFPCLNKDGTLFKLRQSHLHPKKKRHALRGFIQSCAVFVYMWLSVCVCDVVACKPCNSWTCKQSQVRWWKVNIAEIGGGGAERKQDTATLVCALIIFMEWRGKKEKGLIQPAAYQNSPGNPRARSLQPQTTKQPHLGCKLAALQGTNRCRQNTNYAESILRSPPPPRERGQEWDLQLLCRFEREQCVRGG